MKKKQLTIKEKLTILSYIKNELLNENTKKYPATGFICIKFEDVMYDMYNIHGLNLNMDIFPELKAEIIRVGFENNTHYFFPSQLYFTDVDGNLVETNGLCGKQAIWYNKKKLEIVSKVRKKLTE